MITGSPSARRYRAVVFDCGDTLVQLDPPREVIFRDAARELGLDLALDAVRCAYDSVGARLRMKSSELLSESDRSNFYLAWNGALCSALGIEQELSGLHPRLLRRFSERRRWTACSDAADALQELAARAPLYVLANWDSGLETVLRRAGLLGFFRQIFASALLGSEKPARSCFEAFLARTGLTASSTLYVGNDYIADVAGARGAGLTPVLLDREDRVPTADCLRVRTLAELVLALAECFEPMHPSCPNPLRAADATGE